MTPDQIHLLRKSFDRVEQQAQIAVLSFYRRLFELAPEARSLFKNGIEVQSTTLLDTLALAVSLADRPGSLETEMRELGARHVSEGAKDEHYAVVGHALIHMLSDVLGRDFTPATRAAWEAFYAFVTGAMKRGTAIVMGSGKAGGASQPARAAT
jgi:hemoglobin-like flavoprotein